MYFKDYAQSNATLSAVLAYMPSVPMWAYHGSAKRFAGGGGGGEREGEGGVVVCGGTEQRIKEETKGSCK